MLKVGKLIDINRTKLNVEVINIVKEYLNILDCNYGVGRDIDKDLGGYVVILEYINDIYEIKETVLNGIIPEYTDNIECEGGKLYSVSLFLLSSDYSVVVVCIKELMDILLEN